MKVKRKSSKLKMDVELVQADEADVVLFPITAVCIVADKNKCPKGFSPIIKCTDDASDADLWKESSFSIFSRPVRYLAVSREVPETSIKGSPVSVVTDLTVVKESDPIPHGYVAIDYTADSREKALRKRFLCIRTQPRDAVVDAIGEIAILNKTKKTPKGFSCAGEVDGASIVFRIVVIPDSFGIRHSASTQSLGTNRAAPQPPGLYPPLNSNANSHSTPSRLDESKTVNAFTIKSPLIVKPKGVDGVPFKLHPSLENVRELSHTVPSDPQLSFDITRLFSQSFDYNFGLERSILANQ